MTAPRRILVATADPLTARMPGPSIRAWHMAEELSRHHDVQLVTPLACERSHDRFRARSVTPADVVELGRWADVIVFQGGLLRDHPHLVASDAVLVADIYDPFHLENLVQRRESSLDVRRAESTHLTGVLNDQLARGDFFLCASERQRDFWLGSLAALGRVNPDTYDEDATLATLLAVVPFGLPAEPPRRRVPALRGVVPGIADDDHVVLWAGGVYDWFDPLVVVRAIDRVRVTDPKVRLYFMGMQHPNPHVPAMRVATEVRALAGNLGLTGTHVFFNDGWVDYDRRADFLLEADIGISTHPGHIETAYSFRTRVLDYLWAGLPVVATSGDILADLVETEALGRTVPPGDVAAVASALECLLADADLRSACRANVQRVARSFTWDRVLAPLVSFCDDPRRAPDLADRPAPPDVAGAPNAMRRLSGLYAQGGVRLVAERFAARANRLRGKRA